MNDEFVTEVQLKDGSVKEVCFSYELDGYQPLVYGVFDTETDDDLTDSVTDESYDAVYNKLCDVVACRATYYFDMER